VSRASPFPPIGDYAFLSDCEVSALVAPAGSVEWLCLPRPDSPSVFGALLDRSGGTFVLAPASASVPSQRHYMPGSMVLETTWQTPSGWLLVHDCLVMRRWEGGRRPEHYRRAPGDFAAEGVLELFGGGLRAGTRGGGRDRCGDAAHQQSPTRARGARAYGHTKLGEGESAFAALSSSIESGHRTNLNRKVDNCVLTLYLQPYG
jgi:hypothetical protein